MKSIQDVGRVRDSKPDFPCERTNRRELRKQRWRVAAAAGHVELEDKVMILKAALCIASLWLFMPHEPNIGYGTPGSAAPSSAIVAGIGCKALAIASLPCSPPVAQTSGAPDTFAQARESLLERLHAAKADLRANRH